MIVFNRKRLAAVALFLGAVLTTFLLTRKQSFAYLPAGEVRRGIAFLVMSVLWSSFSLWARGRWIWAWPWEVEEVGQSRRAKWYSQFNAMGHSLMYLIGAGLIIYEFIH